MPEKLVVGQQFKGQNTYYEPFNIDNNSFPQLVNAFPFRGRIKRKRGTSPLGRLTRFFDSTNISYNNPITTIALVGGAGNLLTGFKTLETNAALEPGSIKITDTNTGNVYTDNSQGVLTGVPAGTGTVNYATGAFTITGGGTDVITANFSYFPNLPVMGLEDFIVDPTLPISTLAFDTTYSYNITQTYPYNIYSTSFYKNPASGAYPGYIQKTNPTPVKWNGKDYQQFWTTNFQGSLWATNGVTVPFSPTNIGMQYKAIVSVTIVSTTSVTLNIPSHGLVIGDFVFVNEVTTTTGINGQTGYVTAVPDANNVTVTFPNATIASAGTGGIAQYLTSSSDPTKDCIRWYDGDPTNGNAASPSLTGTLGWVNFTPPLSKAPLSISDLPALIYYLVGAKAVLQFKDRLVFFGPVVQSSSTGPFYLQDTIIWSQNGTPYYTASYTGDPSLASTIFNQILVPKNQTATPPAWWEDQTGFGGFLDIGLDVPIKTVSDNKDVVIIGFQGNGKGYQTRMVYSGNDLLPFNVYIINSEYDSSSTFSAISMDDGVITRGNNGFVLTSQVSCDRIDVENPDVVFECRGEDNGIERYCATRDYNGEWIYFTYPVNNAGVGSGWKFPTQTFFFNYREKSWAIFDECYTTYGQFRIQSGLTWATIGTVYPTWGQWNVAWNAGLSTTDASQVIAGNQQGFVVFKDKSTAEADSLYIQGFTGSLVTSPDHCLNEGDYILISGCLGTVGAQVNGKVFSVSNPTENAFTLNPAITGAIYSGGGTIKRYYVPLIQSKQFPMAWGDGKKTRIGVQRYLLSYTATGQATLLLYLSMDYENAWNDSPIVPALSVVNNSLIYSTIIYTCPESTNLGLTPANINLQMPLANTQQQIWHRINTSLIGDTVQFGITLNDTQMRDPTLYLQTEEIEYHGCIIDVYPSYLLA
jgi:hypothetical protein